MLNDYFTAIGKAIQEEKGTVDKYIEAARCLRGSGGLCTKFIKGGGRGRQFYGGQPPASETVPWQCLECRPPKACITVRH
jgi:hypothetical protein